MMGRNIEKEVSTIGDLQPAGYTSLVSQNETHGFSG
jgi:hypothetical protein